MWIPLSPQVKGELRVKEDFIYVLYYVTNKLSFYYLLYPTLFMNYTIETVNMFNELISYSCLQCNYSF